MRAENDSRFFNNLTSRENRGRENRPRPRRVEKSTYAKMMMSEEKDGKGGANDIRRKRIEEPKEFTKTEQKCHVYFTKESRTRNGKMELGRRSRTTNVQYLNKEPLRVLLILSQLHRQKEECVLVLRAIMICQATCMLFQSIISGRLLIFRNALRKILIGKHQSCFKNIYPFLLYS